MYIYKYKNLVYIYNDNSKQFNEQFLNRIVLIRLQSTTKRIIRRHHKIFKHGNWCHLNRSIVAIRLGVANTFIRIRYCEFTLFFKFNGFPHNTAVLPGQTSINVERICGSYSNMLKQEGPTYSTPKIRQGSHYKASVVSIWQLNDNCAIIIILGFFFGKKKKKNSDILGFLL